jgi:SPP1 gp7 family putative phage head morphogenesis protein
VQLEAFFWTLAAESLRLEDALNEQLFYPLGRVNFGDDLYPKIKLKPLSDTKKLELIKLWKDLVSGNAVEASDTDEEHLRELMEFPKKGVPRPKPQVPGFQPQPQGGTADDDQDEPIPTKKEPTADLSDETVSGRGKVSVAGGAAARLSALKRVDFAVIARRGDILTTDAANLLGTVSGELVRELVDRLPSVGDVAALAEDVPRLKLDSKLMNKFQRTTERALSNGWELGLRHAKDEIDKAKKERFSRKHDPERVKLIGEDFFKLKSFTITGKFTDDALNTRFAKDGMVSREFVEQALGHSLDVENPTARLETIVRTNTFEAINEARYAYFTDPALGGFVEALEYSAILDSRTTEICEELDGHVHPADDDFWSTYAPPNHFNCRSLLIPVTQLDTWTESEDDVSTAPAKGFA